MGLPAHPYDLVATAAGSTSIDLTWSNAEAYDGIEIYRKPAGGAYSHYATVGGADESYHDGSCAHGTQYYYKVRGEVGGIFSAYSAEANAITTLPAPTSCVATVNSATQVTTTWTDNSNTETGFEVYMNSVLIYTTAANAQQYVKTGLSGGVQYAFKVRAVNSVAQSAYSGTSTVITTLQPPSSCNATVNSSTQITVTWTDNSTTETHFEVYMDGALIYTTAAGAESYIKTGLTGGVQYAFKVRAINAIANSAYSNTKNAITTLQAPSGTDAIVDSPTQITVYWDDNSTTETGFTVYMNGSLIHTTAAGVESYVKSGLIGGTQYAFQVGAINAITSSELSGEDIAVTTLQAPSSCAAVATTQTQATISWLDNSSTETHFAVYMDGVSIYDTSADVVSYIKTGLTPGQAYAFKVRAYNAVATSAFSNTANLTMPSAYTKTLADAVTPTEALAVNFYSTEECKEVITPVETLTLQKLFAKTWGELVTPIESLSFYKSTPAVLSEELLLVARADHKLYSFMVGAPVGSWDSSDITFDFPGMEKTLSEIRFWGEPESAITVAVSVSVDSGNTWTNISSVLLDSARSAVVFPWMTAEKFRIRFQATGLYLSGYAAYALPRSREGLPND